METITISKQEYNRLLEVDRWNDCLESAGVDNWEGIDEALKLFNEEEEEDDGTCYTCRGTGEGQYDGSSCYSCRGRGFVKSPRNDDF